MAINLNGIRYLTGTNTYRVSRITGTLNGTIFKTLVRNDPYRVDNNEEILNTDKLLNSGSLSTCQVLGDPPVNQF